MAHSEMDLLLGGHKAEVNMIEVGCNELSEEIVAGAIEFGYEAIKEICAMIQELADDCGKEKTPFVIPDTSELVAILENRYKNEYLEIRKLPGKKERMTRMQEMFKAFTDEFCPADTPEPKYAPELVRMAIEDFEEKVIREDILNGNRAGGRPFDELRSLSGEVAVLPRTHGSAIFTRGETQALVTATLGTGGDEQIIDGLNQEYSQRFMLHYNFPPFCVGEVGRISSPGRREIGHGALAERSLKAVIPSQDDFPYTIRLVSDILESNGSSSMATVCGGTLALMDAGVPMKHPVAGISIGMVSRSDDDYILLTDILGEEDHYGDMDFKVAGTQKGITGIQLDLKRRGISFKAIRETFQRAKQARMKILHLLLTVIPEPRPNLSVYAPKITSIQIPVDMIGKVIGPGGKEIKALEAKTGTKIEIQEDGTVIISCVGGDGHLRCKDLIELMTEPVKIGKIYEAKVVAIKDFGVFAEIAPGQEGLCHISELSDRFVDSVTNVCKNGDVMRMKVIAIDEQGRIKLSRKAAIKEEKAVTVE